jgi:excisionase family DNA binding protein
LTLDEAAAQMGVSRMTAYRMVRDGRLPAVQLGGPGSPLRVDERELAEWLYSDPSDVGGQLARLLPAERRAPARAVEAQAHAGDAA